MPKGHGGPPLLSPALPSLPLSSVPYPTLLYISPPLPFPPLEVGPLNIARESVSSPNGVWGEAPVDKRFGAYLSQKWPLWWQQFLWSFSQEYM